MGTNYFARTNICECCGRYDELHIGKSSAGWQFSFRAHSDLTPPIQSSADWVTFTTTNTVKIFDEYGSEVSVTDFWGMVENKRTEPRNYSVLYPQDAWVDPEGYSFSDREFS